MAIAKKSRSNARKPTSPTVGTLAVPIVVYRSGGRSFSAPKDSTCGISDSGALIIQNPPTSGGLITHLFAPGDWVSVNEK
jgi:hypothetical protein